LTSGDPDVPDEPDVTGRTGDAWLVSIGKDTGAMARASGSGTSAPPVEALFPVVPSNPVSGVTVGAGVPAPLGPSAGAGVPAPADVPDPVEVPPMVLPLPAAPKPASVLTVGDADRPKAPVPDLIVGVAPVRGVPPSVRFCDAVGRAAWHVVLAEAGVLAARNPAPPTPSRAVAQATDVIAKTRLVEVVMMKFSFVVSCVLVSVGGDWIAFAQRGTTNRGESTWRREAVAVFFCARATLPRRRAQATAGSMGEATRTDWSPDR